MPRLTSLSHQSRETDGATLSGEFQNARWDDRASPNPCNRRVKHAEGIGKCSVETLTDNIGEAHITTERGEYSKPERGKCKVYL